MRKIIFEILQKLGWTFISNFELDKLRNNLWSDARNSSFLYFFSQLSASGLTPLRQVSDIIRESKSQLGQDILALSLVGLDKPGYFVEFGATNGVDLSNTYMLEKRWGWKGILCEPARVWHKGLVNNRNCFIDTRCVWRQSDELIEFAQASNPVLSTIVDFKDSDIHADSRANSLVYQVKTVSLRDLLRTYKAPFEIDFLSIDTEGSEYSILQDFDFSEYRFNVICIEHNYTSTRDKVFDLLVSNGYKRVYRELSKFDDWYVRSDYPISFSTS